MKVRVKSKLEKFLENKEREENIRIPKSWLARKVGADPSQLHRWSRNDEDGFALSVPNVGYALMLSKILNCNVEDLFEVVITKHNLDDVFSINNKEEDK